MFELKEQNVLKLVDINFFYKDNEYVLKHLNIFFESGKITALLGVNGSGKSTLLKILTGVLNLSSGFIFFNNEKIIDSNILNYKRCLGYMPEYLNFYQDFILEDLLNFFYSLKGLKNNNVEYLLSILDLNRYRKMKIKMLSKGTKQRVNLAQSVLGNPKIVVFDEPSNGFDCLSIEVFYKLLKNLTNLGSIVILTSHHLREIYGKVDVLSFLSRGSITKTIYHQNVFFDNMFSDEEIEITLKFSKNLSMLTKHKLTNISVKFQILDNSNFVVFLKIKKTMLFELCSLIVYDNLCLLDIFVENNAIEKLLLSYV